MEGQNFRSCKRIAANKVILKTHTLIQRAKNCKFLRKVQKEPWQEWPFFLSRLFFIPI